MKTLKMLYKVIYDDLKDADMIVEYAHEIAEEGHKSVADSMIVNAKNRLNHAMATHEQFTKIVGEMKNKEEHKDKVGECLWDVTHEHFVEWYNHIESCIAKWK